MTHLAIIRGIRSNESGSWHAPRPVRIVALIGAGGMGEVYRATDTQSEARRSRSRCCPPPLAGDADRLARFQREAEVLAALNHPNIARDLRPREEPTASRRW